MKKLVVLIFGFLLGALAMYFYCCKQEPVETLPDPPKGLIKPSEIKTLTKAYDSRYMAINDSIFRGVPGGDNRSSWYPLKELRNYLKLAESQASDLGYTMDGVRIYPGAHPADANSPGYTTYLFVPTGYLNTSEGSMMLFKQKGGSDDINGGNGLDNGEQGDPPGANYPQ